MYDTTKINMCAKQASGMCTVSTLQNTASSTIDAYLFNSGCSLIAWQNTNPQLSSVQLNGNLKDRVNVETAGSGMSDLQVVSPI